jgi:hypothetical protein
LSLGGLYGEPSWGEPIQFDRLVIEHSAGITEITVFNRGIHLIIDNTETIRRVHRVCTEVGRAFGGPG